METGDLDQIGGYAYSADDPVNTSDPTGLRTEDQYYDDTYNSSTATDTSSSSKHFCDGCDSSQECVSSQNNCYWFHSWTKTTKIGKGSITQTVMIRTGMSYPTTFDDGRDGWAIDVDTTVLTQYTDVPCLSDDTCIPDPNNIGKLIPYDRNAGMILLQGLSPTVKRKLWPRSVSNGCIHVGPNGTCSDETFNKTVDVYSDTSSSDDAGIGFMVCFLFCIGFNASEDGSTHLVVGAGLIVGVSGGPYVSQGSDQNTVQVNVGPGSISTDGGETSGVSAGPSLGWTFGIGIMHSF